MNQEAERSYKLAIDDYFGVAENFVHFDELIEYVEKTYYWLLDQEGLNVPKYLALNYMHTYIFLTYDERKFFHREIFPNFKGDPSKFLAYIKRYKYKKPVSGIVHFRNNRDLLCVITTEGKIHMPCGKSSFYDTSKKMTAVREYNEECNYLLSEEELEGLTRYKKLKTYSKKNGIKNFYFFKFNPDNDMEVNLNYACANETLRLVWIDEENRNRIANDEMVVLPQNDRPAEYANQSEFSVTKIVKKVVLSYDLFINNRGLSNDQYSLSVNERQKIFLSKMDCSRLPFRRCNTEY